tara:strand:+ start:142 stop:411 length:270 start_codon:yes stop_codon:yes gene_type:complete
MPRNEDDATRFDRNLSENEASFVSDFDKAFPKNFRDAFDPKTGARIRPAGTGSTPLGNQNSLKNNTAKTIAQEDLAKPTKKKKEEEKEL